MLDTLILVLYALGLFFNFTAVVGIVRMPDLYCRLHSTSKNTTLGSVLLMAGVALRFFQVHQSAGGIKVILITVFLMIVTPIGSHALARAAYKYGVPLWEGTVVDQYPEPMGEGRPSSG
jgi:multicomponent Na+:H+ antiporter subunit G